MRMHALTAAIAGALLIPTAAQADIQLLDSKLVVYGKVHVSATSYDDGAESDVEISSNSSRLGFKGDYELDGGMTAIWKFESGLDVTEGNGSFSARNRYLGLKGGFGTVKIGRHDTPMKSVASKMVYFGDTVGDRRSVMGQGSDGSNDFNERATSMIMYTTPKMGGFSGTLLYTPDNEDNANNDRDNELVSVGANFATGGLKLMAAYEDQSFDDGTSQDGFRLGGSYGFDVFEVKAIYESLDGDFAANNRDAYGLGGSMKFGANKVMLQWMSADDSDVGNDAVDFWALGLSHKLGKATEIYGMYATLDNDDAATYSLGRSGFGARIRPAAAGEEVSGFSVGLVHKF